MRMTPVITGNLRTLYTYSIRRCCFSLTSSSFHPIDYCNCILVRAYARVCVCVCVSACMCVNVRACVCACMRVRVCMYVCE